MIFRTRPFILTLALLFPALPGQAAEIERHLAIPFGSPDEVELLLDLEIPTNVTNPPLVLFIHGGGWRSGSRTKNRLRWVVEHGYAVASIEYRLSSEALFPAQIHDCKGALRWLRANAATYGYDASRVIVSGTSAGGHLAALLGTSGDVAELEGTTGGNLDQSSRVQGVINYYGPSDFVKRSENHKAKTDNPKGGVYQLLGGPVQKNLESARLASPSNYISPDDAPLLILHGDQDQTVFLDQSEHFDRLYREAGLDAHLEIFPGAGHGWKHNKREEALVLQFLETHVPAAD